MHLQAIDVVNTISPEEFREKYYLPKVPVIIKDLAKSWPAYRQMELGLF
jgi:hypothetical protein